MCCFISDPLSQFLPPPCPSYVRDTQTDTVQLGRVVASLGVPDLPPTSSLSGLLPLTDAHTVGLLAATLSVSFMGWDGGERQREEGLGDAGGGGGAGEGKRVG